MYISISLRYWIKTTSITIDVKFTFSFDFICRLIADILKLYDCTNLLIHEIHYESLFPFPIAILRQRATMIRFRHSQSAYGNYDLSLSWRISFISSGNTYKMRMRHIMSQCVRHIDPWNYIFWCIKVINLWVCLDTAIGKSSSWSARSWRYVDHDHQKVENANHHLWTWATYPFSIIRSGIRPIDPIKSWDQTRSRMRIL